MATVVPGRRLREACDFCAKRKRKCDGDGVNRCSFCIAKNRPECHYSVRRLTGPRPGSASRRASNELPGKAGTATAPSSASWDDSRGSSVGLLSEKICSCKLPLKRARLRPSPATGLIGLRENVYIADFFRTIGFMPITSESFIRKAMVKNMFCAVQERGLGRHECSAGLGGDEEQEEQEEEEEEEEEEGGWRDGGDVPGAGPGAVVESAAGACILWSTVAVGCLMGGRPNSSVDGYVRLAREALSDCFDDMSVHTARAYTAMALLQNVRGNEENFSRFIGFAKSIMRALPPPEGVPTDLADAHMMFKACDLFDGFYDQLGEEDIRDAMGAALGQAEDPIPVQQAELCHWLLKTDIRLLACFSMDMQNAGSCGDGSEAETEPASSRPGSGSGSASGSPQGSDGDGRGGLSSSSPPHVEYDEAPGTGAGLDTPAAPRVGQCRSPSGTLAEAPPPGPISQKFAARVLRYLNLMMHVTQSPEVRGGVGELYFWMIMAYACLLQGQPGNAVNGFARCTEIFVENPGICRFSSWKHLVHICLACMGVSGNAEKYEQLRASHNSVVDDDVPPAPPFEEFRGMSSICGNMFCKSVDTVFMAFAALKITPSSVFDSSSTATHEDKMNLYLPEIERADVDMSSYYLRASGESLAREVLDKCRRQPQGVVGWHGEPSPPAGAAAAAGATAVSPSASSPPAELGAAFGFVGAFGCGSVENERRPRGTGMGFGYGPGAASARSIAGSSFSRIIISSNSSGIRAVSAGDVAAATAAPWAPADRDGNSSCLGQQPGDWWTASQLLSSGPPGQTSGAAPGPAGMGRLGLLHASQLKGMEAAGLLGAVDELLGEPILEGFGEGGSEEDMLRFFGGNA